MTNRVLSGRYQIISLIGKGGMANVYLAVDIKTGHEVAVKVLRPEFSQDVEFLGRFQREAQMASKVSHHNIVNLLDVGTEENIRYLVMEYVKGTNLKELIKEKGKIPPVIAVQITIRILSALQHTHRNGVIHRDIKPQNILVQEQGHIKIADFGIARVANSATLGKGDSVMGSVHYFSPEQAAGEEVLQTGDIYSVGVVLYEMLTGRVPFEGDSPVAVAMQHIHNKPRPIQEFSPNVSMAVSKVVMKAMEKDPKNRYQNAIDMAMDLKAALEAKNDDNNRFLFQFQDSDKLSKVLAKEEKAIRRRRSNAVEEKRKSFLSRGKKKNKMKIHQIVLIGLGVALTVAAFAFGGSYIYNNVVLTTEVPDLFGENAQQAALLLEKANILGEKLEISSDTVPAGKVISQNPVSGERIKKGEKVIYIVSTGTEALVVPDLYKMTRENATSMLSSTGMVLEIADRVLSEEKVDIILQQSPPANSQGEIGQVVQVVLSGGKANMPDIGGNTLEQAKDTLAGNGFDLSLLRLKGVQTNKNRRDGMVVEQLPQGETETMLRVPITLTIAQDRWQPYQGFVSRQLPAANEEQSVRVILVTQEGEELLQWEVKQPTGKPLLLAGLIYHNKGGTYTYKIYRNEELFAEEKIDLAGEGTGGAA